MISRLKEAIESVWTQSWNLKLLLSSAEMVFPGWKSDLDGATWAKES
jgi:hypothetical protein